MSPPQPDRTGGGPDLGHSLPHLQAVRALDGRRLTAAERDQFRHARRFINGQSDWRLSAAGQVTVESQLRSIEHPELPQVTFHYVVAFDPLGVLDEPDPLLERLGLTWTSS